MRYYKALQFKCIHLMIINILVFVIETDKFSCIDSGEQSIPSICLTKISITKHRDTPAINI